VAASELLPLADFLEGRHARRSRASDPSARARPFVSFIDLVPLGEAVTELKTVDRGCLEEAAIFFG